MKASLILLAVLLTGCQANRVEVRYVETKVPVAVPCLKTIPVRPQPVFGKGELAVVGTAAAAKMLATDLEAAEKYGLDWESAAAGCAVLGVGNPDADTAKPKAGVR